MHECFSDHFPTILHNFAKGKIIFHYFPLSKGQRRLPLPLVVEPANASKADILEMNTRKHQGPLTSADKPPGGWKWHDLDLLEWHSSSLKCFQHTFLLGYIWPKRPERLSVAIWAPQDSWKWSLPAVCITEGKAFNSPLGGRPRSIAPSICSCPTVQLPVAMHSSIQLHQWWFPLYEALPLCEACGMNDECWHSCTSSSPVKRVEHIFPKKLRRDGGSKNELTGRPF